MAPVAHTNSYCEAWIKSKWRIVSVLSARARPALVVRCLECHGPITLYAAGRNNTTRSHAEHRPGHAGCSLGHYFDGRRRPHPIQVTAPVKSKGGLPENEIVIEDDESAFPEGQEKFKWHRSLERDGKIARRAKARCLARTGKLECEICKFDFAVFYGKVGLGFIEAHHRIPVATLDGKRKTKIDELALVCSNCHRMLHRGDSLLTVEQLKEQCFADNS